MPFGIPRARACVCDLSSELEVTSDRAPQSLTSWVTSLAHGHFTFVRESCFFALLVRFVSLRRGPGVCQAGRAAASLPGLGTRRGWSGCGKPAGTLVGLGRPPPPPRPSPAPGSLVGGHEAFGAPADSFCKPFSLHREIQSTQGREVRTLCWPPAGGHGSPQALLSFD